MKLVCGHEVELLGVVCPECREEDQRREAAKDAEIERLRGQLLLEQDRVRLLREDCDHLREVVRQLNDDRRLDAWEEK